MSDLDYLKSANKEIEAIYIQGHLTELDTSVLQTDFFQWLSDIIETLSLLKC